MSQVTLMYEKIRKIYAKSLYKSSDNRLKKLAEFIENKDKKGRKPCWGKINAEVNKLFSTEEAKLELWQELVNMSEEYSLMIYVFENKNSKNLLKRMMDDIGVLPINVQKIILALQDDKADIEDHLDSLNNEIKEFYKLANAEKIAELNLFEERIRQILSIESCLEHPLDEDQVVLE